jgi:TIR domain
MGPKKKIFFTYSDTDKTQFNNLCLHFSVLQDKAEFWYKDKLLSGDDVEEVTKQQLSESDILLHLLSVYSANDTACKKQIEYSVAADKKVIPVLLSSYDWKTDHTFSRFEDHILPEDKQPIDLHQNFNAVCTEIVQDIKQSVFGEKVSRKNNNSRTFYWILASVVLLIGIFTSIAVYNFFSDWIISGIAFLLFVCIDLLILRRLLFPTNISSLKI